jgi:hypothetical protein
MQTPSARNDYKGSNAEWLHKHSCEHGDGCLSAEFSPMYRVSSCGHIWGSGKTRGRAFRKVAEVIGRDGYLWAQIVRDGKNSKVCVHRVVARAFHVRTDGMQVRHLDGNRMNNDASNLRWGTAKENANDRERHSRTARGIRNSQARHSDEDVQAAASMLANGATQRDVAKRFCCSQSTVWRWARGRARADK